MIRLKSIKIKDVFNKTIFVDDIDKIEYISILRLPGTDGSIVRMNIVIYYPNRDTISFSVKPNTVSSKSVKCLIAFSEKDHKRIFNILKQCEAKFKLKNPER